jgi:hypothetical protein
MKKLVLIWLLCAKINFCYAQNSCQPNDVYITDSIGNYEDQIPERLKFVFLKDSLHIYADSDNLCLLSFTILGNECILNKDSSIQKIVFHLLMNEDFVKKMPTLNIIYSNREPQYFELLYPDSEIRIFTIMNHNDHQY